MRLGGLGAGARLVGRASAVRGRSSAVRSVGWFGVRFVPEDVHELFQVYARLLEGTALAAVRECQKRGPVHVFRGDLVPAVPGSQGAGGLRGYDVAAQAVYLKLGAHSGYLVEGLFRDASLLESRLSSGHRVGKPGVGGGPLLHEAFRVGLELEAAAHDFYSVG